MRQEFHTKVVGVTKRNDEDERIQTLLKDIADCYYEGEPLSLEHERNNPYDENAVKVFYGSDHIGYINRDLAKDLAPLVDQDRVEAELCEITGGEDRKSFGCNILIRILPQARFSYSENSGSTQPYKVNVISDPSAFSVKVEVSKSPDISSQQKIETSTNESPPKSKTAPFIIAIIVLFIVVYSIFGGNGENSNFDRGDQTSKNEMVSKNEGEVIDYSEVETLFAEIIPDSDVSVGLKGERLRVKIETSLASDTAPDGWPTMVQDLTSALVSADGLSENYKASIVSVEVYAEDETILASGFDGALRFNLFEEKEPEGKENPPTISKFEYDQVMVGMSLTEVRELIGSDGVLQNEVGTAGVTDVIRTYRWFGEKDGSYADILFSEYKVYSKIEIWLD